MICLLTAYKEDFYEPPSYAILHYLMKHADDQDLRNQCQNLLHRFLNEDENSWKSNSSKLFV
jgi:hypothetical protein